MMNGLKLVKIVKNKNTRIQHKTANKKCKQLSQNDLLLCSSFKFPNGKGTI